jgi:flagellar biosynthetic protein FlhB
MAGEDRDQEKTEEATQQRIDDFRKRGQVAQTKELASCLFILAAAAGILMMGQFFYSQLHEIFQFSFGTDMVAAIREGTSASAVKLAGSKLALLLLPISAVTLLIAVGSSVLQVGFLQVEDALTPKFEKIDPVAGFKRMFSLRALVEGLKAMLKFVFIGAVAYWTLKHEVSQIPFLSNMNVNELISYIGSVTGKLLFSIGCVMIFLAGADFFFQKWELNKQMMMTKQEIKEEHKNREGDPLIKARIRRIQREMANKRMMEKVPQATVIITNPTHIAIALKYDANLPAPQVIAKGGDLIAEKIKAIAKEHNIPIIENKPLARTIFKTLKIGQVIPRELFVAVAEVLSVVFRLKKKVRRK